MNFRLYNFAPIEDPIRPNHLSGVASYDIDNGYPNRVLWYTSKVSPAMNATRIFGSFLAGLGLEGAGIDETVHVKTVGKRAINLTAKDINTAFRQSYARYFGAAVWVGYSPEGIKESVKVVNFQDVRLGERGTASEGRVYVWDNWGGAMDRLMKITTPIAFDAYNPDPEYVQKRIKECGGWEKYSGQIYYSMWGDLDAIYPTAPLDSALKAMDGFYNLTKLNNSMINDGLNSQIIMLPEMLTEEARKALDENMQKQRGTNSSPLVIEGVGSTTPQITERYAAVTAEKFAETFRQLRQQIRESLQLPVAIFGDLQSGKLGNSAEIMEAFTLYNMLTAQYREHIASELRYIFEDFAVPALQQQTFEVQPLTFMQAQK